MFSKINLPVMKHPKGCQLSDLFKINFINPSIEIMYFT